MLKGDLATTPLPDVLTQLADGVATGCLHVDDGVEEARVYLRGGLVYSVQVPGMRPQLGARLISSGALGPEALAEAMEAQRTELQGWRLGELLVHLGYVDQAVVESFVTEQVRESTADLLQWESAKWRFRVNERTREDVAPPTPVVDLLAEVARRRRSWEAIAHVVHGPEATPMLSAAGVSGSEMEIEADAWSLLCKVDGSRTIAELSRDCGFTLYEASEVIFALAGAGLVEVAEPVETFEEFAEAVASARPAADTASVAARLVDAFTAGGAASPAQEEPSPTDVAALITSALRAPAPRQHAENRALDPGQSSEQAEGTIDKVSQALAALLGPAPSGEDAFAAPTGRGRAEPARSASEQRAKELLDARRDFDAAELALAQAELESAKLRMLESEGPGAEIVDLEEVRREAARRDDETERERSADSAQRAAEQAAAEAAAEHAAAEQAAAEHAAAEQAAAEQAAAEQAAAEQAAAEQAAAEAAAAEHAAAEAATEQAAAEQAAAEQAAAEQAAAEQAAAEQAAAEQAAAEQAAAEQAAAEQAAAEQAAAEHAAAEQAAAEHAAAEQAAAEAAAAERAAAEQAAAEQAAAEAAAAEQAAAEEAAAAEAAHPHVVGANEEPPTSSAPDDFFAPSRSGAEAAAAFAELSATAQTAPEAATAGVLPAHAEPDDEHEAREEAEDDAPAYVDHDTDTASLLRELAFLGHDEEAAPAAPSRPANPARPPSAGSASKQKKKGLFGRG